MKIHLYHFREASMLRRKSLRPSPASIFSDTESRTGAELEATRTTRAFSRGSILSQRSLPVYKCCTLQWVRSWHTTSVLILVHLSKREPFGFNLINTVMSRTESHESWENESHGHVRIEPMNTSQCQKSSRGSCEGSLCAYFENENCYSTFEHLLLLRYLDHWSEYHNAKHQYQKNIMMINCGFSRFLDNSKNEWFD